MVTKNRFVTSNWGVAWGTDRTAARSIAHRNPSKLSRTRDFGAVTESCLIFFFNLWKGFAGSLTAAAFIAGGVSTAQAQTSLSLHDAIARAQISPAARIAQEQVNQVHGQVRQAGLRPNPRIYLSTEDSRPWVDGFSFPNNTEDYGYLGQTFELDGKRSKRTQFATANLRRTQAEQALQMQQIAGRVAGSYWAAAASVRVAALLEQDLAAVDAMVRYHKERVDAGAMRGVDLLRIQIERDRLFVALETARRDVELTRVDLFRQIGAPASKDVFLTDSIGSTDSLPQISMESVFAQRPDLAAAHDAVAVAKADVKLQRAIGVPDPDVLGGYKRNSGTNTLFASLQVPLPFFNRNQGEIERAEAGVRLATAQLQQVELMVRAEVEAATDAYESQRQIVQNTLPDMRDRAKRNLEILNDAYRTGGVDLLRYIDAERTEIDVEVSAIRTLSEYHQSVLRLQLAYGVQP